MQGNRQLTTGNSPHSAQNFAIEALLKKLHTATPVRVEAVYQDAETGLVGYVDVVPLLRQVDGEGQTHDPSRLYHQPFLRIQGGKNAVVVNPQKGDIGLSAFAERDCSVVATTRRTAQPGSPRFMDAADGWYLGGFLNGAAERYILIADDGIAIEGVARLDMHGRETVITAEDGCTINADVRINGNLTWTGTAQGVGGAARFSGGLVNDGGQIESNGVVVETHRHGDVEPGAGTSGEPV